MIGGRANNTLPEGLYGSVAFGDDRFLHMKYFFKIIGRENKNKKQLRKYQFYYSICEHGRCVFFKKRWFKCSYVVFGALKTGVRFQENNYKVSK